MDQSSGNNPDSTDNKRKMEKSGKKTPPKKVLKTYSKKKRSSKTDPDNQELDTSRNEMLDADPASEVVEEDSDGVTDIRIKSKQGIALQCVESMGSYKRPKGETGSTNLIRLIRIWRSLGPHDDDVSPSSYDVRAHQIPNITGQRKILRRKQYRATGSLSEGPILLEIPGHFTTIAVLLDLSNLTDPSTDSEVRDNSTYMVHGEYCTKCKTQHGRMHETGAVHLQVVDDQSVYNNLFEMCGIEPGPATAILKVYPCDLPTDSNEVFESLMVIIICY